MEGSISRFLKTISNNNGNTPDRINNMRAMLDILCNQCSGLHVCHLNAQSLYPKIDEFRYVFEGSNMDIICVSETWYNAKLPDILCNLKGYDLFRADRNGQRGGGVAIYIRSSIIHRFVLSSDTSSPIEYCFVEILNGRSKCLTGIVYRPNTNVDFSNLYTALENISSSYSEIVVCGDFNCNLLNSESSKSFVERMYSLGLYTTNFNNPTHYSNDGATLLDLFFSNNIAKFLHYDQLSASAFSKHDLIFATFNIVPRTLPTTYEYRDFKNIDLAQLEVDIHQIDWQQIYFMTSADDQVTFLQNSIKHLFDTHVKLKTKVVKNQHNSWFTQEILEMIKQRDLAYKHWKRFRLPELLNSFRVARNKVRIKIRESKIQEYSNRLNKDLPPKTLWKNIRDLGVGRINEKYPANLNPDVLNSDFAKVQSGSSNLQTNLTDHSVPSSSPRSNSYFQFQRIEEADVVINTLKIKSRAMCFDEMHPLFIKMILPHILPTLTHIFNTIIMTCSFPCTWKTAKVIPVVKKPATRLSPPEYRPISILPFISKVFEKLLHSQISSFITNNNLLCVNQSGFRQNHSCVSAVLKVTEELRRAMDGDLVSFLGLLDFSKAFDTVNHSVLISKMKSQFWFSDSAANLMLSYLSGRSQAVAIGKHVSGVLKLFSGVPQGSILGPLLFSMCINDLPVQVQNSSIDLYADDAQIRLSCKLGMIENGVYLLNKDLDRILRWSEANNLRLNPTKSKCLVVYKNKLDLSYFPPLHIGNQEIVYVEKTKNLGIWFNSTLSWDYHIQLVIGKVYGCLRSLSFTKLYTPQNIRLRLAKTLIIPLITYGCQIFCSHSSESRRNLTVAFNNVVRYVYNLKRFDHVSSYTKGILGCTLYAYINYHTLKALNNIITRKEPSNLYDKITFSNSSRSFIFIQPRFTCILSERQFFVYAVRQWNSLPLDIRKLRGTQLFQRVLFRYLAENS